MDLTLFFLSVSFFHFVDLTIYENIKTTTFKLKPTSKTAKDKTVTEPLCSVYHIKILFFFNEKKNARLQI